MGRLEALFVLGVFAVSALLLATMFHGENFPIYQNFAVIGGSFLFLFVAIIAGLATRSIGAAVASGSLVTAIVEAYIYPEFSVIMGLVFGGVVGLGLLAAYLESKSSGYSDFAY